MNKRFVLVGVASVLIGACKKDNHQIERESMDELVKADPGLKNVMLTLVSNGLDLEAVKEIHSSISITDELGLDEVAYAKELLSSSPEKFNGAPVASRIMNCFEKSRPRKMALRVKDASIGALTDKPSKASFYESRGIYFTLPIVKNKVYN